ncbi:inclusion body protein [Rahnella aquatilis CIP 78.65 = ATCC 33071]|uniref:Inclusion body protein n=1 Tax=Rahnella aquatilis (strain ATCC 33071 / DSM 4594 / JCM 1683 / NBRC 105701 / NCIMB 13365 / CIP 78.65) TaxID=745277 RepID=H2IRN0_RAHAC|nr:inclusion body family protein [Rahnella aquatilis]AEX52531.1 Inclusion body protein [Rahnella aquatilis CIP 78.65 = ATCC 33071]KFD06648.1 inclusion body protein [Rahnella aquatilis CIP 78.65 = ATCC 33071]
MEIVDVLIAVDAPRIIRDFHKNDVAKTGQYQSLGEAHGYIYMIATWYHARDEADSELDVFAKQGDKIRWRMTTLSMGGNYQGVITGFVINNGAVNITPPVLGRETIITPQLDAVSNRVILTSKEDVFWESTVLKTGKVTYHTKFQLYVGGGGGGGGGCEGSNGGGGGGNDPCGGYHWDPFIN